MLIVLLHGGLKTFVARKADSKWTLSIFSGKWTCYHSKAAMNCYLAGRKAVKWTSWESQSQAGHNPTKGGSLKAVVSGF